MAELEQEHLKPPVEERRSGCDPVNSVNFQRHNGNLVVELGGAEAVTSLIDESAINDLRQHGFIPKENLHMTVLNYDNGSRLLRTLKESIREDDYEVWLRLVELTADSIDWSWQPTKEIHPFRGKDQGSLKIITPVECPGVSDFYGWLEDLLPGIELVRHPMHVTIMKKPLEMENPEAQIDQIPLGRPLTRLGHLALGY